MLFTAHAPPPSIPLFHSRRVVSAVLATAAVAAGAACGRDGVTAPRTPPAPGVRADVAVPARTITVCKSGSSPAGTYTFSTAVSGNQNAGDVYNPANFTLTVATGGADACAVVYTRTVSDSTAGDTPLSVVVTEAPATGTVLSNITATGGGGNPPYVVPAPVVDVPNRRVTLSINGYHDATATFFNTAAGRNCTYTIGWYKNKGRSTLPSGTFFSSGKTYLQVLQTSPRGEAYYILAHQYIAATLNVQAGAQAPSSVTDAIAKATAYFNGTLSLKQSQITSLADLLTKFNEGKIGPGHCGDQGDQGDQGGQGGQGGHGDDHHDGEHGGNSSKNK